LDYAIYTNFTSILDSTLVRRITCYFHPGHCYVPARPVTMRAIEDIYEQWSTAAIHAAEATVTASSGLVRLAAAPRTISEYERKH